MRALCEDSAKILRRVCDVFRVRDLETSVVWRLPRFVCNFDFWAHLKGINVFCYILLICADFFDLEVSVFSVAL